MQTLRKHTSRRALSLVEVAVSVAVASVLVVSIGSVIVLSSKALPENSQITRTAMSAGAVTDQLSEELRYAIAFSEMTPTAVTFVVPDRTGDAAADTIRYSLDSGVLNRKVNAGSPVPVVDRVSDFKLSYTKRKVTQTSNAATTVSSGEVLFARFTGPGSLLSNPTNQMLVTGSAWIAIGFSIDEVSIPASATKVRITRATFRGRKPPSGAADVTATIHHPQSAGSAIPATAAVGSPGTFSAASAAGTFGWVEIPFPNVAFDGPVNDLVLLLKGTGSGGGQFQYMSDTLALLDSRSMRWTGNSGGTWQPGASLLGAYDMFFHVYGSYESTTVAATSTDTYYLTNVDVNLQTGATDSSRIQSAARVLNEPGVAGP